MKKVILIWGLLIGASQLTQAQLHYGITGGLNYNSNPFTNVQGDFKLSKVERKMGFHAGVWGRLKLPILGLFLRPELIYTQLNNNLTTIHSASSAVSKTDYTLKKIDIPVLVGTRVLRLIDVFAGPSFQYILSSDFKLSSLKEVKLDEFTLGFQLGAGIELGKIGLTMRWERAFSKPQAKFVNDKTSDKFNFDTRINQVILGLSYQF